MICFLFGEESSDAMVGVRYDHGRHWIERLSRWSTVDSLSFNIWNRSSSNLAYWINELVSVTHCGLKKIKWNCLINHQKMNISFSPSLKVRLRVWCGMVKRKESMFGLKDYHLLCWSIIFIFFYFIEIQIEFYCFRSLFPIPSDCRNFFFSTNILRAIQFDWDFYQRRANAKQSNENQKKRNNGSVKATNTQSNRRYHIFHCLLLLNALRIVKRIIFDKRSNAIKRVEKLKRERKRPSIYYSLYILQLYSWSSSSSSS